MKLIEFYKEDLLPMKTQRNLNFWLVVSLSQCVFIHIHLYVGILLSYPSELCHEEKIRKIMNIHSSSTNLVFISMAHKFFKVLIRRAQVADVLPGNFKVNPGQDIMISVYNVHRSSQVHTWRVMFYICVL